MLYCLCYDPKGFDGIFRNGCEAEVKQFQRDHKLIIDGFVGKSTLEKFWV
jgi:peptidoglycan hydrolase-like protein with peptidoglycan-binding domain